MTALLRLASRSALLFSALGIGVLVLALWTVSAHDRQNYTWFKALWSEIDPSAQPMLSATNYRRFLSLGKNESCGIRVWQLTDEEVERVRATITETQQWSYSRGTLAPKLAGWLESSVDNYERVSRTVFRPNAFLDHANGFCGVDQETLSPYRDQFLNTLKSPGNFSYYVGNRNGRFAATIWYYYWLGIIDIESGRLMAVYYTHPIGG